MHPDRTIVSSRSALTAALQRAQQRRGSSGSNSTQPGPGGPPPSEGSTPSDESGKHNADALLKLLTGIPTEQSANDTDVAHDGLAARLFIAEERRPGRAAAVADISFRIASSAQHERNRLLKHILALERLSGLLELIHPGAFLLPLERPSAADTTPMFVVRNHLARLCYRPVNSGYRTLLTLDTIVLQLAFDAHAIDESSVFVLPTIEEAPLPTQIMHKGSLEGGTRALYAAGAEGMLLLSNAPALLNPTEEEVSRFVEIPLRLSAHPVNAAMQLSDYRHGDVALRHGLALLELGEPRLIGDTGERALRWYRAGDRLALHFGATRDL